jgi:tetratricopeptide (TPR) repeat protein
LTENKHVALCGSLTILVTCLRRQKHGEDAEVESLGKEALERALELQAAYPTSDRCTGAVLQATGSYVTTLKAQGRHSEMETVSRRAVEIGLALHEKNPRRTPYHLVQAVPVAVALAKLQFERHDTREALANYRHAATFLRTSRLYLNPNSLERWGIAATDEGILECLEQLVCDGHRDEARRVCEELSANERANPADLCSTAMAVRAWDAIGEHDQAEKLVKLVFEQSQSLTVRVDSETDDIEREAWSRALYALGDQEFRRSNSDRSLQFLDLALQWNPQNADALARRGQILLRRN